MIYNRLHNTLRHKQMIRFYDLCADIYIAVLITYAIIVIIFQTSLFNLKIFEDYSNKNIKLTDYNIFTEIKTCNGICSPGHDCAEGLTKYYNIDNNICQEICIDTKGDNSLIEYIAPTNTICEDLGYSLYRKRIEKDRSYAEYVKN